MQSCIKQMLLTDDKPKESNGFKRWYDLDVHGLNYGALLVENTTDAPCEHTIKFNLIGMNINSILPASSKLHRDREMSLQQMKNNQQTGTITTKLKKGEQTFVVFEWVCLEVGASMN